MKQNYRYHPKTYDKTYSDPEYGIECFYSEDLLMAIFYAGKSSKHIWHYKFYSREKMFARMQETTTNVIRNAEAKKTKKTEEKAKNNTLVASDHFKTGDIIVNTWGYEQTNVDFFQVTEVLNKKIRVAEIWGCYKENGFMSGETIPAKNEFKEDGEIYLLSLKFSGDDVVICNPKSFYYFRKWNGKPMYESHYA